MSDSILYLKTITVRSCCIKLYSYFTVAHILNVKPPAAFSLKGDSSQNHICTTNTGHDFVEKNLALSFWKCSIVVIAHVTKLDGNPMHRPSPENHTLSYSLTGCSHPHRLGQLTISQRLTKH